MYHQHVLLNNTIILHHHQLSTKNALFSSTFPHVNPKPQQLNISNPPPSPSPSPGSFNGRCMCSVSLPCSLNSPLGGAFSPFSFTSEWAAVDVQELSSLLLASGQNCHLFPAISECGCVARVDAQKLGRALRHSTVVVAVYMKDKGNFVGGTLQMLPWMSDRRKRRSLVAFGRATSDRALTACIHDLVVAPSLKNSEVRRWVLQRLVRDLVRLGIYDISVLVRPEQREFFRSCGFGADRLGSTTMMYPCKIEP